MFSPEKVAEARRAMKGEDADGNKLETDAWAAEDDDDDETAIEMAPKASRFSPSFQDPAETHLYKDPPSPTTPTFGSQVDYTPMYEPLQERAHEELEELMLRDGGGGEGSRRGMVSRLIAGARSAENAKNPRYPVKQKVWKREPAPVAGITVATAAFDADPRQRGAHRELSFRCGDMLSVLTSKHPPPEGWLFASNAAGEVGLVPASFLEMRMVPGRHLVESASQRLLKSLEPREDGEEDQEEEADESEIIAEIKISGEGEGASEGA